MSVIRELSKVIVVDAPEIVVVFNNSYTVESKAKLPEPSDFKNCDADPSFCGSINCLFALLSVVAGALSSTAPPPNQLLILY